MIKRVVAFIIFFSIFSTVYSGMNYYVYQNIIQGISNSGVQVVLIRVTFWSFGSAYLISQFLKRRFHVPLLSYVGALWMGILSISFTVFLLKDVAIRVLGIETDLYLYSIVLVLILIFFSVVKVLQGPQIKKVNIEHQKNLKHPMTIVHLSDTHLGMLTSKEWLKNVVSKVNSLEADIIVITGDMVDDSFQIIQKFVPVMKELKASHGVFAVSGNHEYYQGLEHFQQFCEATNIKILDNEAVTLGGKMNLVGIADEKTKSKKGLQQEVQKILESCNPELYNILLMHQPVGFQEATKKGIDLQLSGHTHRGQIPPLNIIVKLVYRYAYGLHSYGQSHIYTTSGTGTWGPPMRLFSDSEIVRIRVN